MCQLIWTETLSDLEENFLLYTHPLAYVELTFSIADMSFGAKKLLAALIWKIV